MITLTQLKLLLGAVGLAIFAYGFRTDDARIRWAGITFVFAAFLLRFWRRPPPPQ